MIDKSLGFCIEYFLLYKHSRRRVWDLEEEKRNNGELLMGQGMNCKFSANTWSLCMILSLSTPYIVRHF